ncbi:unnamed protein product [[Candida] boidinii]|nr:unnamed protein product [[Candida] boidinii]
MRDGEEIHRGKIKQIKVFKDVVSEVKNGGDCGIILEGDPKIKEGDVIEAIEEVPIKRHFIRLSGSGSGDVKSSEFRDLFNLSENFERN